MFKINFNTYVLLLFFVLWIQPQSRMNAQITIGANLEPAPGAILDLKEENSTSTDLKTSSKGLALPRVKLTNLNNLFPMFAKEGNGFETTANDYYAVKENKEKEDLAHTGLWVYHVSGEATPQCGEIADGIYIWTSKEWKGINIEKFDTLAVKWTKYAASMDEDKPYNYEIQATPTSSVASYKWYFTNETNNADPSFLIESGGKTKHLFGENIPFVQIVHDKVVKPDKAKGFTLNCEVVDKCGIKTHKTYEITANQPIDDIVTGNASIQGVLCFDVAMLQADTCGLLVNRYVEAADFANREVQDPGLTTIESPAQGSGKKKYSGVQTYTLRAPIEGNKSQKPMKNIRLKYDNINGDIVDKISDLTITNGSEGAVLEAKFTVYYKDDINQRAAGLDRYHALQAMIYAIYESDVYVSPSVTLPDVEQKIAIRPIVYDCGCCGANTLEGEWMPFLCHNLGADESLPPYEWHGAASVGSAGLNNTTPNGRPDTTPGIVASFKDIKGWLFQWGRVADGHQARNSATHKQTWLSAADLDELGQVKQSSAGYGKFITSESKNLSGSDPGPIIYADWSPKQWDTHWGGWRKGGFLDAHSPKKGKDDPCPKGWKVPSYQEWGSIVRRSVYEAKPSETTANKWTWLKFAGKPNGGAGFKVGEHLYLPIGGFRHEDGQIKRGIFTSTDDAGFYWTATSYAVYVQDDQPRHSYGFSIMNNKIWNKSDQERARGYSIRCIQERDYLIPKNVE